MPSNDPEKNQLTTGLLYNKKNERLKINESNINGCKSDSLKVYKKELTEMLSEFKKEIDS
jgi:hypothetical protein